MNRLYSKPSSVEFLERKWKEKYTMGLLSDALPSILLFMEQYGISQYFDFLLSCEEVGVGKREPDVYFEAVKRLQEKEVILPENVAVYEDADYAIHTVLNAGFYTIAVYDDSNKGKWEQLKAQVQEAIADWNCASQSL